jgi:hypothetical protein
MAFATARPTRENIAIGLNLDPKSLVSIAHTLDHGDCLSAQWNYVEIKIFPLDVNDLALAHCGQNQKLVKAQSWMAQISVGSDYAPTVSPQHADQP